MLKPNVSITPLARVLGSVYESNSNIYRALCSASSESEARFWDIVIVTACNQDQRNAYLQRIQRKLKHGEIPRSTEYLVIEDPPGSKISSGGSTIYVFVTSADGIELFASKAPFPATAQPLTITALAHPSPLNIAMTHGVFELEPEALSEQEQGDLILDVHEQNASLHKCLRFHHKPSMEHLQKTPGLTFKNLRNPGEALAYTDSCYYFDPQTADILASLYPDLPPRCDLEAWADILHFQDELQSPLASSPSASVDDHALGRNMVQRALLDAGAKLQLLVLNASRFYHLGTMTEFLEAVCLDTDFMAAMGIDNPVTGLGMVHDEKEAEELSAIHGHGNSFHPPLFVQNSHISDLACLPPWSMIIDTDLPPDRMEHCSDVKSAASVLDSLQHLPNGVCVFTLQLAVDRYVTFTFSTMDDMKKLARPAHIEHSSSSGGSERRDLTPWWETLCIFGTIPVARVLPALFFAETASSLSARSTNNHCNSEDNYSLWDAPIFEVAATKQASTSLALQRLERLAVFSQQSKLSPQLHEDTHIIEWISFKEAARKARPYEMETLSHNP
ncbi:hypothetical protein BGW41_008000 [Actinomortierella wolfii]|nr:hypothetical protein BGW41_008000 [Actinomortierella wolfii]